MTKSIPKRLLEVWGKRLRRGFAQNLELNDDHKVTIYIQLADSVRLGDISFWLEVLFSAGIATLGLVLNSPGVIIGAMLISPLMGSILANGLALAMGDIVLALRSLTNLVLSSTVAVLFALLLVVFLPFQEITPEIAARTQPNFLDLIVALFSGAVGAIATCKQVKGVVASLPGVAIAVALMPPLCVVGYGLGTVLNSGQGQGWALARGGGLLFFTNLVAIIFTSVIVFFFIRFDTPAVTKRVMDWKKQNPEIQPIQAWVDTLPLAPRFRSIGNLPSRVFLILVTLAIISLPLNQSLGRLRQEILQRREDDRLREQITALWQESLEKFDNGEIRAYLNRLNFQKSPNSLTVNLQVVTNQLFTAQEKTTFVGDLAQKLGRSPRDITLNLIEIPARQIDTALIAPSPLADRPSWTTLQSESVMVLRQALQAVLLPPDVQLVTYEIFYNLNANQPPSLRVVYLGDRPLGADAQALVMAQVRRALEQPTLPITLELLPKQAGSLTLTSNPAQQKQLLAEIQKTLQHYPNLYLKIELPTPDILTPATEAQLDTRLQDFKTSLPPTLTPQRIQQSLGPQQTPAIYLRWFLPTS
jgi:uncharacterized hydrophobic protein (TIGR00271 family)